MKRTYSAESSLSRSIKKHIKLSGMDSFSWSTQINTNGSREWTDWEIIDLPKPWKKDR